MKYSKLLAVVVLSAVFCLASLAQAQNNKVDWEAFSINLVKAVKSDNPKLQQSAMQHIIKYADKVNVDDAVWTIARIFGFDKNPSVRRLAMVTLYKINTQKSLSYLQEYLSLEDNQSLKRQGNIMIKEYWIAQHATEEGKEVAQKR
ncbi:MAG: HEAT repeat domain-containing protein [Calditrichaeota bacterium]|nr:HEAT repeat domain-containing protein [Calditrichota bacterium]